MVKRLINNHHYREALRKSANLFEGGKKVRGANERAERLQQQKETQKMARLEEAISLLFSTDFPDDAVVEYVARNIGRFEESSIEEKKLGIGMFKYRSKER